MAKLTEKYGIVWSTDCQAKIELACIKKLGRWKEADGREFGMGLFHHVREFQKIAFPNKYWHRWNEGLLLPELCKPGRIGVFGPSSSGKSMEVAAFVLTMFYANPKGTEPEYNGTTGIISSTTLDALKRRIWDYVVKFHKQAKKILPFLPGHLIESKQMLLADEKNEEGRSFKNGVIGVACKKGGQWQGLQDYVGTKNAVMILAADEVTFMPGGFWDSVGNLESNDVCFAIAMGNLSDLHNPLATACEPRMGWDSIPDTLKSRVYATRWMDGRAVQFIGTDSPNLDFPEGKEPFKNLIGRRYIAQCAHNYGVESDRYNMFALGKIPRTSMTRTVFTRAQCLKWNAYDDVVWGHEPVVKGFMLDAAYSGVGGDRTPGSVFTFGRDVRGVWRFHAGPVTIFRGSESTKISHSEAIALQCRSICEDQNVPPEHVFYDGTGRSELTIAFARLWSAKVVPIEFGGPATERPGFTGVRHTEGEKLGDIKTCRESYDRFVTELWFAWATCIVSDQMRGLNEDTVDEGCRRTWEEKAGAKQSVETKEDMRERTVRSPDLGDMIVCGIEGARRLGFPLGKTPQKTIKRNLWIEHMREEGKKQAEEESLIAA